MYEIHVARFYMKRRAYVSAANRASYVVKEFQRTPAVPYALQVMQAAYTKLGLDDLAADAARVYQENFLMDRRYWSIKLRPWLIKSGILLDLINKVTGRYFCLVRGSLTPCQPGLLQRIFTRVGG